jgi:hypothetical protein
MRELIVITPYVPTVYFEQVYLSIMFIIGDFNPLHSSVSFPFPLTLKLFPLPHHPPLLLL